MATIHILLATYNGGTYLARQIESIRDQTHSDWRVIARDDGSTDDTMAQLADWAASDPRVTLLVDAESRMGAAGNFARLLAEAQRIGAEYVCLADQDDVWRSDKLVTQGAALQALEREQGHQMPLLVHSDLTVVDRRLKVIHPSFLRFAGVRVPPRRKLQTLLVVNHVTGCTTLFNRALLERALPMPSVAMMHDWWLALCAAAWGRIGFVPQPTVAYRQHGGNVVGGEGVWRKLANGPRDWARRWRRAQSAFAGSVEQNHELSRRLHADGSPEARRSAELIDRYCDLVSGADQRWRRRMAAYRFDRDRLHPMLELALLTKIASYDGVSGRAA